VQWGERQSLKRTSAVKERKHGRRKWKRLGKCRGGGVCEYIHVVKSKGYFS
jgi:hypothetical protein